MSQRRQNKVASPRTAKPPSAGGTAERRQRLARTLPSSAAKRSAGPRPTQQPNARNRADREPANRWRFSAPAWAVSAVVHTLLLISLALVSIAVRRELEFALVATVPARFDELETVTVEVVPPEPEEMPPLEIAAPALSAGEVGALWQLPDSAADRKTGPLVEMGSIGDIKMLFGADGPGMLEVGGPGKGSASFFGVKTEGQRFVFVVDNSNSMNGGKFETAVHELMRSVNGLNHYQQFYVIFFSDTAYPMFYPRAARDMIPATEENKQRLEYWLMTVERCLKTKGREAMRLAFSIRPDAIYVLGDGSFTDKTVEEVLAMPVNRPTMHTLGFRMKPNAEQGLRQMAEKFGGRFTEVEITPAMVERSRKNKRPRNSARNGVWGIKLGSQQDD